MKEEEKKEEDVKKGRKKEEGAGKRKLSPSEVILFQFIKIVNYATV